MNYATLTKYNKEWSFDNFSKKETNYATHGYHNYPAKFIPQLVRKLLMQYSSEGELVVDPFGGCGTTLIESYLAKRNSLCMDINDVAVMISKAKKSIIPKKTLEKKNELLLNRISKNYPTKKNFYKEAHSRLKYWFKPKDYNNLMIIDEEIKKEKNKVIRNFYHCCFSNILKKCSIWYSKSIKPMTDQNKVILDPLTSFTKHLKFMTERNEEFFNIAPHEKKIISEIKKGDARKINLEDNKVDLVITSPPYVTSYEYAELHQLSSLWFKYSDDINKTKKDFIGTSSRKELSSDFNSKIAERVIQKLYKKNKSLSRHASNYYSDLYKSFSEIHRILKKDKYACIIMGNTEYKSIKILNTESSIEMLKNIGFEVKKIIKRKLSSKTFTPYRDYEGKFTTKNKGISKKIYQYEYIIIAQK